MFIKKLYPTFAYSFMLGISKLEKLVDDFDEGDFLVSFFNLFINCLNLAVMFL